MYLRCVVIERWILFYIYIYIYIYIFFFVANYKIVGPCHHGMARPQVVDRGTASGKEGSCE